MIWAALAFAVGVLIGVGIAPDVENKIKENTGDPWEKY